jgi:hypothetical protein
MAYIPKGLAAWLILYCTPYTTMAYHRLQILIKYTLGASRADELDSMAHPNQANKPINQLN